jgi:hypothetical protein
MAKISEGRRAIAENEQLRVQLAEADARIAELEAAVREGLAVVEELQKPAARRTTKS